MTTYLNRPVGQPHVGLFMLALFLCGGCDGPPEPPTGTFSFAASGTSTALWAYMQPYFWGFDSEQISAMLAAQLLSAVFAFGLIPKLTRNREKRGVLIQMSIASMVVGTGPVFLSLLGLFGFC